MKIKKLLFCSIIMLIMLSFCSCRKVSKILSSDSNSSTTQKDDSLEEDSSDGKFDGEKLNSNDEKWKNLNDYIDGKKSASCSYTAIEITNILIENENVILENAKELKMPTKLIYSILIQEMTQTTMADDLADSMVESYFEEVRSNGSSSGKSDSSTGLGQIFAKTAIYSHNNLVNQKVISDSLLQYDDISQREKVWTSLKNDNAYNIKFVGYCVKSVSLNKGIFTDKPLTEDDITTIFYNYNGSGQSALNYANATYEHYKKLEELGF